jgi:hypothetical protein
MILCLVSPHLPQQIDFSVQDLNVIPNQVCQTVTQLQLPARLETKLPHIAGVETACARILLMMITEVVLQSLIGHTLQQ